jgi:hypothetical protein
MIRGRSRTSAIGLQRPFRFGILAAGLASMLLSAPGFAVPVEAVSGKSSSPADFKYVGGTEKLSEDCQGKLEITSSSLVFSCPEGSIRIPYDSIVVMQYRSDVSRQVRRMKLDWVLKPLSVRRKNNRYFTLVYTRQGRKQAIILDVSPDAMRPYLAEIDLKSGRRVDVENHEKYNF